MDVFGMGSVEVQRIIGTQREANYCKAVVGLSNKFVEVPGCLSDFGLGPNVVRVDCIAQDLRIGNGVCDLAMVEIGGKCHETGFRKLCAESLDGVVQAPPGMQDQ